ncbi:T9SS type A sorting domain-containing protein [bacterium]|nr:T9SS type A sorting domain-containing protein [bacterium]
MRVLYTSILLSVAMLCSSATADVLVTLPDTSACRDSVLCIPITVGDVTGQNVVAFSCSLNFNPAVVNVATPHFNTAGGLVAGWTILDTVNNGAGWLKIGGFGTTPLTGSGQLLCLNFRVLPGAAGGAVSPLNFARFVFNEGTPAANVTSGSFTARYPAPAQVTDVIAGNNLCDRIHITWEPAPHADGQELFRDDILVLTMGPSQWGWDDHGASVGTHQYKVRAFNSCGYGPFSATVSGTRLGIPAAPSPVVASDTSCTSVWITWQDVAGETSYQVNRGAVPIGLSLPANTTSFRDTTGTPGTTYQYIVLAVNVCGNTASTDSGRQLAPPGQPTGVAATTNRCDSVIVTWNAVSYATMYYVYRGVDQIGSVSAGTLRFADAPNAGTYSYSVRAWNDCGWGSYSTETTGTRLAPPPQVTGVTTTSNRCDSVIITWNAATAASEYFIFRDAVQIGIVPTGNLRYADAPAAGTYLYRVRALNSCDWGPYSSEVEGTRLGLPAQVTGVAATTNRCDSVIVTWNVSSLATSYEITRNWVVLSTLPGSTIRFVDAPPPGTYSYRIRAMNICGNADASSPADGTRRDVPAQVAGVSASDDLCNGVQIAWSTMTSVDSFQIRRNGSRIGRTLSAQFNFLDTTAVTWTVYEYTVVAYNLCGVGPTSLPDNGMRMVAPAQVIGVTATTDRCDSIIVTWTDVEHESGYFMYRYGELLGALQMNTVRFADAPEAGVWGYTVLASNACGNAPMSVQVLGEHRAVPSQVMGVNASDGLCNGVVITWNNVAGEDSFQIRRNGTRIAAVLSDVLTYTDTTAVPGVVYSYSVVAYNLCGPGPVSASDNGYRATLPTQVTNVQATINRCDSVIVTWTDVATETLYRVFRDGIEVGTRPANATRFAEQPPTGTYQYTVRAENACGNGPISAPATGTRLVAPLPPTITGGPPQCMTIVIFPAAGGGDVDSFFFYRDGANRVGRVHASADSWEEMIVGTHNYYATAYSVDCNMESAPSNILSLVGHDLAFPPTTLTVTTPETCDSIRLSWPQGTGEIESYVVRRDGNPIDTVAGLVYRDIEVDDALDHEYAVAAYNRYCGVGDFTAPVTGRMRPLIEVHSDLADTLQAREDTVYIALTHCSAVEVDSFFMSFNNGPFLYVTHAAPPVDTLEVVVPEPPDAYTDNCRARIISYRGTRSDTTTSDPFVIYRDLAVDDLAGAEIPKDFTLDQNYPNPFNPATTVRFGVPKVVEVRIEIFDVLGRHVTTLAEGVYQPGWHRVIWDCSACPTGMYILRMQTDEKVLLRKMLLMK